MDVWTIVIALYVTSTMLAIIMTYREQKRSGHITPVYSMIGYMLCMIWPVVAAVMMIFYRPKAAEMPESSRLD